VQPVTVYRLPVDGGHVLHVEEHGNPAGIPALLLHGGPGSGASPALRRFFDPARYRIICPDQRGAGRSTPAGAIEANTLADLLADLRLLRDRLQVERWLVVGGSWGATLALLHALDQPGAVSLLLLRNVFLARAPDIAAFFGDPAAEGSPGWRALLQQADTEGCSAVEWLARLFASGSRETQRAAALGWSQWERHKTGERPAPPPDDDALDRLVHRYRVQSHYLRHGCWLERPTLLERCAGLSAVRTLLLHGTQDAVCPPEGAVALKQVLGAAATLRWVHGAGHDPGHPAMEAAMRQALRQFAEGQPLGL
jgi:proline iminopeptidase